MPEEATDAAVEDDPTTSEAQDSTAGAEETSPDADAPSEVEAEAAPEAQAEDEPEAEAAPEPEAEAAPEPEAEAAAPDAGDEEAQIDPAVIEHIGQDTTVVHHDDAGDEHGVPSTFRTPPGIPSGLDPGTLADRDRPV